MLDRLPTVVGEKVMNRVSVKLENCYGIGALDHVFDFSGTHAIGLYAPNGVMKSSLAETFYDAAMGRDSQDRIFKDRKPIRKITDETGAEITGDRILVVRSYDAEYGLTDKISTLLVSAELRKESEQLEARVEAAKDALLSAIRNQTGSKRNFATEISLAFRRREGQFEDAAISLERTIERQEDAPFADVKYDIVFNEKVIKALEDSELMVKIKEFVERYNLLLKSSNYFRNGTFDYYNAEEAAKALANQGFFEAEHTVNLYSSGKSVEITSRQQLMSIIEDEKKEILADPELQKAFDTVLKKLNANKDLRDFRQYLQNNEAVLSKMDNIEAFRQDVLRSYVKVNEAVFSELMQTINSVDKRRKEIVEIARQQTTEWDKVLKIFNDRFHVPFKLAATNKLPVMLGQVEKPLLGFKYSDGRGEVDISREDLQRVLSMGERRALYLINVIFELRRRIHGNVETLIIVDDIADSFDYNNKYAIIQYLQDVSRGSNVNLIIMTHNFDFFRTIESRLVGYKNCLMASKNESGVVSLDNAECIRGNMFSQVWRRRFFRDTRQRIASIPFIRNIIEMTLGVDEPRYAILTSMLHIKPDTDTLMVSDLDGIFNSICEPRGTSPDPSKKIIDLIWEEANAAEVEEGALKLENKIVLAIGIRLAAETFVIREIQNDALVASITKNQTRELIEKYKNLPTADEEALEVLDRVELMTPENIHVNAFMYEPLIDMNDHHLRRLYTSVKALR